MGLSFNDYRGVKDLVIAPLTIEVSDGNVTETYGAVQPLSGVQAIQKAEDQGSDTIFYDNGARIAVGYEGADTYQLTVSVLDLKTRALIEGRTWDETKKAFVGTKAKRGYFALGYKAGLVGDEGEDVEEYVWVYKGKFSGGDTTHNTEANNTDTTNVTYTYTSVFTNTEYAMTDGKHAVKNAVIRNDHPKAAEFFSTVTTPDKITVG